MTVGEVVKAYRTASNMTQAELAELLEDFVGVGVRGTKIANTISRLENNHVKHMGFDRAKKAAMVLDIPIIPFLSLNCRGQSRCLKELQSLADEFFTAKLEAGVS